MRVNHYDMNLVFIDELLDHFYWTGDTAYVRQLWPVLQRHLAWEKRNFDMDGDGLYDAYCCIWASDALEYSGGGVTHSSAYNYRANKVAADLAVLIGEDPMPYRREAEKILRAMNTKLWMPQKGCYAEYVDRGTDMVHPAAGLWTIYHAIDSRVPDPFQSWQSLHYIDTDIPHIPVRARGIEDTTLYTLSTTNWQPYSWSLNDVVMAESLHTALGLLAGRAAGSCLAFVEGRPGGEHVSWGQSR
jgi:Glycogen debranching enzyme